MREQGHPGDDPQQQQAKILHHWRLGESVAETKDVMRGGIRTRWLCQHEAVSEPAPGRRLMVSTVDYHTAGEPFRIVSGGMPSLRGRTILEKRRYALDHLDDIRQLLVFEPRGHSDMYGGFLTQPRDQGAPLGGGFFSHPRSSTAGGPGTIALLALGT